MLYTFCHQLFIIFSGAIGFDKTDGFWLITSLPKFPSPKSKGYTFPSNGHVYGQTFLCISMNYDMLDIVGELVQITSSINVKQKISHWQYSS